MKDHLFFFRGGLDFTRASPEQLQQVLLNWKNWTEELSKKGIYGGGERLTRNEAAVVNGNARQVIDGPFADSKENIGGKNVMTYLSLNSFMVIANDSGCG